MAVWPQLRDTLTRYVEGRHGLLFPPANRTMLRNIRGAIGSAVKRAQIQKRVTLHTFRHTCAATRLQTVDHRHPVSPYAVMWKLGHSSLSLIEKTNG